MYGFIQDVRFGARILRRTPGATTASALTLSIGIAGLTAMFSLLNGLLLRPLPYPDPDRLVIVYEKSPEGESSRVSLANFLAWKSGARSFGAMGAIETTEMNLTGGAEPERISASLVSPDLLGLLGAAPSLGSPFAPDQDAVVLSDALWDRRFGRDPGVIGRRVSFDGIPHTVAGILPRDFRFFQKADAFLPLRVPPDLASRENRRALVIGRLSHGVTLGQANAGLESLLGTEAAKKPGSARLPGVEALLLHEALLRGPRADLPILLSAAALLLLTACANVAGLAMATSAARRREFAIRFSLGASRSRVVRQVLIENILLALFAGTAGLSLAAAAAAVLRKQIPPGVVLNPDAVAVDFRVLGFALVVCFATGIVLGILPGWRAGGESLPATRCGGSSRLRSTLVVAEIAISLMLLCGAALMVRALAAAQSDRAGGPPASNILTLRLALPAAEHGGPADAGSFFHRALESVSALPGVQRAALSTALPYTGGAPFRRLYEPGASSQPVPAIVLAVSPSFFETIGVPVERGRAFTASDAKGAPMVAAVNRAFTRRLFSGADPIGQQLRVEGEPSGLEIVAVAGDWSPTARLQAEPLQVYVPFAQHPAREARLLLVAPASAIPSLMSAVRQAIRLIDNDQPVSDIATLESLRNHQLSVPRMLTGIAAGFGAVVLLLALVGTYGLMSFAVTNRTHEIGVRAALGATPSNIVRLIGKQGALLTLAGLVLGSAGAAAVARLLRGLLFGVPVQDYASLGAMALVLVAGSLAAAFIPARRAAALDPAAALRHE